MQPLVIVPVATFVGAGAEVEVCVADVVVLDDVWGGGVPAGVVGVNCT